MKISNIFPLCVLFLSQSVWCENTQPVYQIAKWYDDKKAAVSVNFDDNLPGQFSTALPILNAKGVKATFYVITNTAGTQWPLLQSAIDAGHEVGSHSVSHPLNLNPPALTQVQIEAEMKDSHDALLTNLTGQSSLSISWPYGKGGGGSDSVVRRIAKKYYFAARNTTAGTVNGDAYTHYQNAYFSAFGRDYYMQSGGILMASTTTKANIGTFITEIIKTNGWFSPFYHAVNQVGGYNNVTTELFQQHIDTIASQGADLWITPFGNASKYHHERNIGAATVTAIAEDASNWTLNLTDNLDNVIFNQPLTILLNQPSFSVSSITQNSMNIPFSVNAGVLKFNALPDGGDIILEKNILAGISEESFNQSVVLVSNPESFVLTINGGQEISKIALYNSTGVCSKVFSFSDKMSTNQSIVVSKNEFPKGLYILRVEGERPTSYKLKID